MADHHCQISVVQRAILRAEITVGRLSVSDTIHYTLSILLRDVRHYASGLHPSQWNAECTILLSETNRVLEMVGAQNITDLGKFKSPLSVHVCLLKAALELHTPIDPEINQQSLDIEQEARSAINAFAQHLKAAIEEEAYEMLSPDVIDLRKAVNNTGFVPDANTLRVIRNLLRSLTESQTIYEHHGFIALSLGLQWCTNILVGFAKPNVVA
jgi:hypothetical protein